MTRKTTHNSGLAKDGVSCLEDTFVQGSSFVLGMKIIAKIPHHFVTPNDWLQK